MSETRWIDCEGTFTAKVLPPSGGPSGWFHESTEKKTPYIALYLEVSEDSVDAGKIAKWTGYLSEKALPHTIRTLHLCFGFNGDLADLAEGKVTFAGREVSMVISAEEYNGKVKHKVQWLNPVGYQPAPAAMNGDAVKLLCGALGSKAKMAALEAAKEAGAMGVKGAEVKIPKAQSKPVKPPVDDDSDVPF